MPKRLPKGKQGIARIIPAAQMEQELEKSNKILHQIELVMKLKKLLATQGPSLAHFGVAKRLGAKDVLQ